MDQVPFSGYSGPPRLIGYTFSKETIIDAIENKRLLSIHIEINSSCNLQCPYCKFRKSKNSNSEIDISKLFHLVETAKSLGAISVVITGGEPTLHSGFVELIEFINKSQMVPVVFTNAVKISQDSARFLFDNNVSVMARLDSFYPSVQDQLCGISGSYVLIHAGLHNLFEAGFANVSNCANLRLGVSFISSKLNRSEIEEIWHFCRRNGVYPNLEIRHKRAGCDEDFEELLSEDEIMEYRARCFEIDSQIYNYKQILSLNQRPSDCLKPLFNIYVTVDGNVYPCEAISLNESSFMDNNGEYLFNINRADLCDIYNSGAFRSYREVLSKIIVNGNSQALINYCTGHCGCVPESA